jgi:acetyl-CoA synthetase (ADP-forming)
LPVAVEAEPMPARAPARLAVKDILHPRSVAVFGASDNVEKFGGRIMTFLVRHGFPGRIVPINPRRQEVLGRPAYAAIGQSPERVDVAILAVPPAELVHSVAECAEAGVGCAVVMTTGFAEAGAEGAARQAELVEISRRTGMRIVGPNCMGVLNPAWKLALCSSVVLDVERLLVGRIGLISQSGALMVSVFDRAYGDGIGFRACVSLGNQSDLEICDFLEYMIAEPEISAVCMIVEGFVEPPRFMRAAEACRRAGKPLILLKTGRTPAGVVAARSHTASLAGSYDALEAFCRKAGVLLVDDPDVMVRLADLLVRWPERGGDGIGAISGSGGGVGILADRLSERGLRLASLAPATRAALAEILLPPQANNPIDLGGRKFPESVEIAGHAMTSLGQDPDVSIIFIALSTMPFFEARTRLLAAEAKASGKPVIVTVLPGPAARRPREVLRELDLPAFDSTNDALAALERFVEHRRRQPLQADNEPVRPTGIPNSASELAPLGSDAIKALLAHYGIPLAREAFARGVEEAVTAARKIGTAVALKGIARNLVHKSDVGAVKVRLSDEAGVRAAWHEIMQALARHVGRADIEGCLVQEMIEDGTELIVGIKRDEQYGPFVLAGFGGILVELTRDVRLAPAPVSQADATDLLRGLRAAALFDGVRGRPALDLESAADVVARMSWLAADLGERLVDAEINPLMVRSRGKGAVAVDVRGTIQGNG